VLRSWADPDPLKVNYQVNAEKSKCNLQSDPFIFLLFVWWAGNFKDRAFEQCIATWGSILMRQSLEKEKYFKFFIYCCFKESKNAL